MFSLILPLAMQICVDVKITRYGKNKHYTRRNGNHLSAPQNYVGRKLEVLLYPVDELTDGSSEKPSKKKPSDFAGTLSVEEGEKFYKYVKQSRNEWERNS